MVDIKVKPFYSGWRLVTKDQAIQFAKHLYNGITTMSENERIQYINSRMQGYVVTKDILISRPVR